MSDIDELHNRIDAVENKVDRLRDGLAHTHTLASMTDREVAGFGKTMRAHTRVLNALRETQVEQGRVQAEQGRVQAEQGRVQAEQGRVQAEQGETLGRHTEVLAGQDETLTTIVGKLDAITRHLGIDEPVNGDPAQN